MPARTVRYYDKVGLVCPGRTPAGYRVYEDADVRRLALVRDARAAGCSIAELRELLASADAGDLAKVTEWAEAVAQWLERRAQATVSLAEAVRIFARKLVEDA